VAYLPVALAGFVWDDLPQVVGNLYTAELRRLPRIFLTDVWSTSGVVVEDPPYYRPLLIASFAVDRALFGLSPAGHHLHSLLWHVAAVCLLWALLRRLLPSIPALAGAALFALHPVQSEAVAWVSARNDPMAASFLCAALLALLPARPGAVRLALGALALLAALLSKELAVLGCLLVLALDLARHGRPVGAPRYLALALALAVWAALREAAGVSGAGALARTGGVLAELPELLGIYGRLLVLPWPLTTARRLGHLHESLPALALGWTVLLLLPPLLLARGRGLAAAGLVFAGATLGASLLGIGATHQVGERYLYVPLLGLALAAAAALPARPATVAAALGLCVPALVLVGERLPDWSDPLALARSQVEDYPGGSAYGAFGLALRDAGRPEDALPWLLRALEADPPAREVCAAAVETPLRLGNDAAALALARLGLARRCPVEPRTTALYAVAFARAGAWEQARTFLRLARPDASAEIWGPVAGALAVLDGDLERYRQLRDALHPAARADFAAAVGSHLAAGGAHVEIDPSTL
jgi:tetratricopeptide (TPR) repeat protein